MMDSSFLVCYCLICFWFCDRSGFDSWVLSVHIRYFCITRSWDQIFKWYALNKMVIPNVKNVWPVDALNIMHALCRNLQQFQCLFEYEGISFYLDRTFTLVILRCICSIFSLETFFRVVVENFRVIIFRRLKNAVDPSSLSQKYSYDWNELVRMNVLILWFDLHVEVRVAMQKFSGDFSWYFYDGLML